MPETTPTRDVRFVRFTAAQLRVLEDAAGRRIRQLEKSIKADSGVMHRALDAKCQQQLQLKLAREALRVASAAPERQHTAQGLALLVRAEAERQRTAGTLEEG